MRNASFHDSADRSRNTQFKNPEGRVQRGLTRIGFTPGHHTPPGFHPIMAFKAKWERENQAVRDYEAKLRGSK